MAVVATIAAWFLISFLFVNIFFVKLKSIDQTVIDLWCMTNKINGRLNDLLRRRLCVAHSFAYSFHVVYSFFPFGSFFFFRLPHVCFKPIHL